MAIPYQRRREIGKIDFRIKPASYAALVLEDTPILYWELNETAGTFVKDSSGNNNHGTYTGSYILGVPGIGSAVSFNGSTGRIYTTAQYQGLQTFTLEARFKTNATVTQGMVGFSSNQDTTLNQFDRIINLNADGKVSFLTYRDGIGNQIITSNNSYNDGNWHSVTAILSSSGQELYIDGSLVVSNPAFNSAQNYQGYWHVGFAPNFGYFDGVLDEVAIYDKKLSSSRILEHYQAA